jgi:hypothetical protein
MRQRKIAPLAENAQLGAIDDGRKLDRGGTTTVPLHLPPRGA